MLREHGPHSGGRGVHFHPEWYIRVWMAKDGGRDECRLQVFECFVVTGVPGQGLGLFAEQRRQRGSMSAEIIVEPTIEVCEAEKPL